MAQTEDLTEYQFEEMVRTTCEEVGTKHAHQITLANRKYLRQMLEAADRFEKQGITEHNTLNTGCL